MKIIITEKQADRINEKKVECHKCGHNWTKTIKDKQSNLCHMCGWDNEKKSYNDKELLNFWKKETNINEVVNPQVNLNSGKKVVKYLTKRIPFLKYLEYFVNDNREDEGIINVQFQNVTYNQNVEMVNPTNEGITRLEFEGFNTVIELFYYRAPMSGAKSEPTRYRYYIKYEFELAVMFKNKPNKTMEDELFERIFIMAKKQSLEKMFHYYNEIITDEPEPPKEFLDESINEINKKFFLTEEYIEKLPANIKNPLSGYSDKEINEMLNEYFDRIKKRQIK